MTLFEISRNPTTRQLRQFGAICTVILPLLGWMWGGSTMIVGSLGVIGALIAMVSATSPTRIKPIYVLLTFITAPIGKMIGELLLAIVYYAVIFPIGIIFRLTGRDPLAREIDRDAETYWQPKESPTEASSYYRQS